jgi:hypothetical protein
MKLTKQEERAYFSKALFCWDYLLQDKQTK